MIKVVDIFESLFATLPEYNENQKPFFHYGEEKELNRIILDRQSNQQHAFPLLWYNIPSIITESTNYTEGIFEFVIAHNTKTDWDNSQRFTNVFNEILFPCLDLVIQAFKQAMGIDLNFYPSRPSFYEYTSYPNWGNVQKTEQKIVDIADALKFKVKLRVYKGSCYNYTKIIYNT